MRKIEREMNHAIRNSAWSKVIHAQLLIILLKIVSFIYIESHCYIHYANKELSLYDDCKAI